MRGALMWLPLLASAGVLACASARERSALPLPPGIRTRVDTTYYDVDGREPRAWLASMSAAARAAGVTGRYHAQTTWNTRWRYASSRRVGSTCEVVEPTVEAEIRFVMPRLRSDSALTPEASAEWRRYLTSLWRHEEGHARRGLLAAVEQERMLRRTVSTSCDLLTTNVRLLSDQILARYRAENAQYDEVTSHGARQGALLIVDPKRPLPMDTTYRDVLP